MRCIRWSSLLFLALACPLLAQPPEVAPAPRPAPQPAVLVPMPKVSKYAVWNYYEVDRQGFFRTRVIDTPYGAFYPLTGKTYPWTSTNARNYMPYAKD